MTLAELHHVKDFATLFEDERFKALLNYRREHINKSPVTGSTAEQLIFSGAYKDGWLDCLNSFSELATPLRPGEAPKDQRLYSERPR